MQEMELYNVLGEEGFTKLVAAFYRRVRSDDLLSPMYHGDFDGGQERLGQFLIQRFGGPTTYSDQRGHPRLRMRHAPFAVDVHARNRWVKLMGEAMEECQLSEEVKAILAPYFANTATGMMNR